MSASLQNCLILHFDSRCLYPLFFCKIVEIKRIALRVAILDDCQNYWGGGGGTTRERSIFLTSLPPTYDTKMAASNGLSFRS